MTKRESVERDIATMQASLRLAADVMANPGVSREAARRERSSIPCLEAHLYALGEQLRRLPSNVPEA